MLTLTLLLAGIIDLGRMYIMKEQMQTAADAASVAAANTGVHRWVQISVTTDRGEEEHCTSDGEGGESCSCDPCGTVTISGIVGDENRLIDQGGWQDYVLPECSCGGGDHWFTIQKRWVTYDIQSGVWGVDPGQINKAVDSITNAAKMALSWKAYPYENDVAKMVSGYDLYGLADLLNSTSGVWQAWLRTHPNCDMACDYCYGSLGRYGCDECYECRATASYVSSKLSEKRGWINQLVSQVNTLKNANSRGGLPAMQSYVDDAAHYFYSLNTVPGVNGITRINVHQATGDPYYPSITVYAKGFSENLWKNFLGVIPDYYKADVCSQGDTYYRDPATQTGNYSEGDTLTEVGKWIAKPKEACWKDMQ